MTEKTLEKGTTLARITTPTSNDMVRFAIIGDPHLAIRSEGTSRRFELTEHFLSRAITEIKNAPVDAIISVGDLTKDGERWNFDRIDDLMEDVSCPFYSIPGNHDVQKLDEKHDSLSLSEFESRYAPNSLPCSFRINDITFYCLNTASSSDIDLRDTHEGHLSENQQQWLQRKITDNGKEIVLMHHNLPPLTNQLAEFREAIGKDAESPTSLLNGDEVLNLLNEFSNTVLFTGHRHRPGIAEHNGTVEAASPSLCVYPQGYYLVKINDLGTTIKFIPITDFVEGIESFSAQVSEDAVSDKVALASVTLTHAPIIDEFG